MVSVMPQHCSPSWLRGSACTCQGSQRPRMRRTPCAYHDKVFPDVITELTACLFDESLITDPSEGILVRCGPSWMSKGEILQQ